MPDNAEASNPGSGPVLHLPPTKNRIGWRSYGGYQLEIYKYPEAPGMIWGYPVHCFHGGKFGASDDIGSHFLSKMEI